MVLAGRRDTHEPPQVVLSGWMCASTSEGSAIRPPPSTTFAPRGAGPLATRPSTTTRSVGFATPKGRTFRKTTALTRRPAAPDTAASECEGAVAWAELAVAAMAAVVPARAAAPASMVRRERATEADEEGCTGTPWGGAGGSTFLYTKAMRWDKGAIESPRNPHFTTLTRVEG